MPDSDAMKNVDLPRFWRDDQIARADPFGPAIPQPPLGIRMNYETVFAELGLEFDPARLERDYDFARSTARAYNDRAEEIVGRRLLNETQYDPTRRFPPLRIVGELFGCRQVSDGWSVWLLPCASTPRELEAVLDRMDRLDLRAAMFPDDWDAACRRVYERHGLRPGPYRSQRGPVTLATSIYGVEELVFLIHDERALAGRFRDVIARVLLEYFSICDEVSDPARRRPGFAFLDDNCAMLTPEMYAFFGQPILQAMFARFAPGPADRRYQHSDSDMEHLLPQLARTGLNGVNFGPNVRFARIRAAMPRAVIEGTLAPFTFMRNDEEGIIAQVRRDCEEARATRGLVVATAGSVNNGSRLTSLRAAMHAIQNYGRYDRARSR